MSVLRAASFCVFNGDKQSENVKITSEISVYYPQTQTVKSTTLLPGTTHNFFSDEPHVKVIIFILNSDSKSVLMYPYSQEPKTFYTYTQYEC